MCLAQVYQEKTFKESSLQPGAKTWRLWGRNDDVPNLLNYLGNQQESDIFIVFIYLPIYFIYIRY